MLKSSLDGKAIEASVASRGQLFLCPQCHREVILKQGRIRVPHFAHKPPSDCTWAAGETTAHMLAKAWLAEEMRRRGIPTEVEYVLDTLPGDRRADVASWVGAIVLAFEFQHTSIGLEEIEARAFAYARRGIAQLWLPFIRPSVFEAGEWRGNGVDRYLFVERYAARPFERWVHGLNGKEGMWMNCPSDQTMWRATLKGHQYYVNESTWYEEGGIENSAGGYFKWSKRYRELSMYGPYQLNSLGLTFRQRQAHRAA